MRLLQYFFLFLFTINVSFAQEPIPNSSICTSEVERLKFIYAVKDQYPTCVDDNNQIVASVAATVTTLNLNAYENGYLQNNGVSITCVDGLEKFTNLQILNCSYNALSNLDVSFLKDLTQLYCAGNQLVSLDVSQNAFLETLDCSSNKLTNLKYNTANLTLFDCSYNELTSLDVTQNANLQTLICSGNHLTSLNVSQNHNLSVLNCSVNEISSILELPASLFYFDCAVNLLTVLPALPANLYALSCQGNLLTSMPFLPSNITMLQFDSDRLCLSNIPSNIVGQYPECLVVTRTDDFDPIAQAAAFEANPDHSDFFGTLRWALMKNNLAPKNNRITFAIPLARKNADGQYVINITSATPLYANYELLEMAGASQDPSYNPELSNPLIVIDFHNQASLTIEPYNSSFSAGDPTMTISNIYFKNFLNHGVRVVNSSGAFYANFSDVCFWGNGSSLYTEAIGRGNYSFDNCYFNCDKKNLRMDSRPETGLYLNGEYYANVNACKFNNFNLAINNATFYQSIMAYVDKNVKFLNCNQNIASPSYDISYLSMIPGYSSSGKLMVSTTRPDSRLFLYKTDAKGKDNVEYVGFANQSLETNRTLNGDIYYDYEYNPDAIDDIDNQPNKPLEAGAKYIVFANGSFGASEFSKPFTTPCPDFIRILDAMQRANEISDANGNPVTGLVENGAIIPAVAATIRYLDVSGKELTCMTGIEYFTGLTYLNCAKNLISNLDVNKNTVLTQIDCRSNQLTSLDMSKNTTLTQLDCSTNKLSSLDMSNNTALAYLRCESNQIVSLNVSKNSLLSYLVCYSNRLSSLDVSNNTKITGLFCHSNQIRNLDIGNNTSLTEFMCHNNMLSVLDVTQNIKLTFLNCGLNQLHSLDVSKNTELIGFICGFNHISNLDVSKNIALTKLYCNSNPLCKLSTLSNSIKEMSIDNAINCLPNIPTSLTNLDGTALVGTVAERQALAEKEYPKCIAPLLVENNVLSPDGLTVYNNQFTVNRTDDFDPALIASDNSNLDDCQFAGTLRWAILKAQNASLLTKNRIVFSLPVALKGNENHFDIMLQHDMLITMNQGKLLSIEGLTQPNSISENDVNYFSINPSIWIDVNYGVLDLGISADVSGQNGNIIIQGGNILMKDVILKNVGRSVVKSTEPSSSDNISFTKVAFINDIEDVRYNENLGYLLSSKSAYSFRKCVFGSDFEQNPRYFNSLKYIDGVVGFFGSKPTSVFTNCIFYGISTYIGESNGSTSSTGITNQQEPNIITRSLFYNFPKNILYPNFTTTITGINTAGNLHGTTSNNAATRVEIYESANNTQGGIDATKYVGFANVIHGAWEYQANLQDATNSNAANPALESGKSYTAVASTDITTGEFSEQFTIPPSVVACPSFIAALVKVQGTNFATDINGNRVNDIVKEGKIDPVVAATVTYLDVSGKGLTCMTGIEYFTGLTHLSCGDNLINNLDVTKNTSLAQLNCYDNQLISLDLSKNTALTTLFCNYNQLSNLDVTHNAGLSLLTCNDNQLSSLDLTKNTSLAQLDCHSNQLNSLDVSKNTALISFSCYDNQLSSLDVSHNTALAFLLCYDNQLSSLDVKQNTALTELLCHSNHLSSLDLTQNTALGRLDCYDNPLCNISTLPDNIQTLYATSSINCLPNIPTSLTNLDGATLTGTVAERTDQARNKYPVCPPAPTFTQEVSPSFVRSLKYLQSVGRIKDKEGVVISDLIVNDEINECVAKRVIALAMPSGHHTNEVERLYTTDNVEGIDRFVNLEDFSIGFSGLNKLDLSGNKKLKTFSAFYAGVKTPIDFSNNLELESIACGYSGTNGITGLKSEKLKSIRLAYTEIYELDVEKCINLERIECHHNENLSLIKGIDKCIAPLDLYCSENSNLTNIQGLSNAASLVSLNCFSTKLSNLDLDKCVNLKNLKCNNNPSLVSISNLNCPKLEEISCYDNPNLLSILNLNTPNLKSMYVYATGIKEIDFSNCTSINRLDIYDNSDLSRISGLNSSFLNSIDCHNTSIYQLDVSKCTGLTSLNCYNDTKLCKIIGPFPENLSSLLIYNTNLTCLPNKPGSIYYQYFDMPECPPTPDLTQYKTDAEGVVYDNVFLVNRTDDFDPSLIASDNSNLDDCQFVGALRWAMLKAKIVAPSKSRIVFDLSPSSTITIRYELTIPNVKSSANRQILFIDGTTQAGYQASLLIDPNVKIDFSGIDFAFGTNWNYWSNIVFKGLFLTNFKNLVNDPALSDDMAFDNCVIANPNSIEIPVLLRETSFYENLQIINSTIGRDRANSGSYNGKIVTLIGAGSLNTKIIGSTFYGFDIATDQSNSAQNLINRSTFLSNTKNILYPTFTTTITGINTAGNLHGTTSINAIRVEIYESANNTQGGVDATKYIGFAKVANGVWEYQTNLQDDTYNNAANPALESGKSYIAVASTDLTTGEFSGPFVVSCSYARDQSFQDQYKTDGKGNTYDNIFVVTRTDDYDETGLTAEQQNNCQYIGTLRWALNMAARSNTVKTRIVFAESLKNQSIKILPGDLRLEGDNITVDGTTISGYSSSEAPLINIDFQYQSSFNNTYNYYIGSLPGRYTNIKGLNLLNGGKQNSLIHYVSQNNFLAEHVCFMFEDKPGYSPVDTFTVFMGIQGLSSKENLTFRNCVFGSDYKRTRTGLKPLSGFAKQQIGEASQRRFIDCKFNGFPKAALNGANHKNLVTKSLFIGNKKNIENPGFRSTIYLFNTDGSVTLGTLYPEGKKLEIYRTDETNVNAVEYMGSTSVANNEMYHYNNANYYKFTYTPDDTNKALIPGQKYIVVASTQTTTGEFSIPYTYSKPRVCLVTRTTDDYLEGSLRWALGCAMRQGAVDTVKFAIPTADTAVINLNTNWAYQDGDGVIIDGYSQSGTNKRKVHIVGNPAHGHLEFIMAHSTMKGLIFTDCKILWQYSWDNIFQGNQMNWRPATYTQLGFRTQIWSNGNRFSDNVFNGRFYLSVLDVTSMLIRDNSFINGATSLFARCQNIKFIHNSYLNPGNTSAALFFSSSNSCLADSNVQEKTFISVTGSNNTITNNYLYGATSSLTGTIRVTGSTTIPASNNYLANNIIDNYGTGTGIRIIRNAQSNTASKNLIYNVAVNGIELDTVANSKIKAPILKLYGVTDPDSVDIEITARRNGTIEIFKGNGKLNEATGYIRSVAINSQVPENEIRTVIARVPKNLFGSKDQYIIATLTDLQKNTSQFSNVLSPFTNGICVVKNTSDDDIEGSLRAAIRCANFGNNGKPVISFAIDGADAKEIKLRTPLPTVRNIFGDSVVIDGGTQASYSGNVGDANIWLKNDASYAVSPQLPVGENQNSMFKTRIKELGANGISALNIYGGVLENVDFKDFTTYFQNGTHKYYVKGGNFSNSIYESGNIIGNNSEDVEEIRIVGSVFKAKAQALVFNSIALVIDDCQILDADSEINNILTSYAKNSTITNNKIAGDIVLSGSEGIVFNDNNLGCFSEGRSSRSFFISKNIEIKKNQFGNIYSTTDGIIVQHATQTSFAKIDIDGNYFGISKDGTYTCPIQGNALLAWGDIDVSFTNNYLYNISAKALSISQSGADNKSIYIRENVFGSSDKPIQGDAIYIMGNSRLLNIQKNTFDNPVISNSNGNSIYVSGIKDGFIRQNEFLQSASNGIYSVQTTVNIKGNTFQNLTKSGVFYESGSKIIIDSGNVFKNCQDYGVDISGYGVLATIKGNTFENNLNSAIYVRPANSGIQEISTGNAFKNNNVAIKLNYPNTIVHGNTFVSDISSKNNGILIESANNSEIIGNIATGLDNTIGSFISSTSDNTASVLIKSNTITGYAGAGIDVTIGSSNKKLSRNILNHATKAININYTTTANSTNGNANKKAPTLTKFLPIIGGNGGLKVDGTAEMGDSVEIFITNSDLRSQTTKWIATIYVGATNGSFSYTIPPVSFADYTGKVGVRTTATVGNNTSELSNLLFFNLNCSTIVSKMTDAGDGTLRDAITCAYFKNAPVDITFALPNAGPYTISLATNLPYVYNAFGHKITIDGTSQVASRAGSGPDQSITINKSNSAATEGLVLFNTSEVKNLSVTNFGNVGVRLIDGAKADNVKISGCKYGLTAENTSANTEKNSVTNSKFWSNTTASISTQYPYATNPNGIIGKLICKDSYLWSSNFGFRNEIPLEGSSAEFENCYFGINPLVSPIVASSLATGIYIAPNANSKNSLSVKGCYFAGCTTEAITTNAWDVVINANFFGHLPNGTAAANKIGVSVIGEKGVCELKNNLFSYLNSSSGAGTAINVTGKTGAIIELNKIGYSPLNVPVANAGMIGVNVANTGGSKVFITSNKIYGGSKGIFATSVSNNEYKLNKIEGSLNGISIQSGADILIQSNELTNISTYGIDASQSTGLTINGLNKFVCNTVNTSRHINLSNATSISGHNTIEANMFEKGQWAIYLTKTDSNLINYNKATGVSNTGIRLSNSDYNTLVSNDLLDGINGIYMDGSENNTVDGGIIQNVLNGIVILSDGVALSNNNRVSKVIVKAVKPTSPIAIDLKLSTTTAGNNKRITPVINAAQLLEIDGTKKIRLNVTALLNDKIEVFTSQLTGSVLSEYKTEYNLTKTTDDIWFDLGQTSPDAGTYYFRVTATNADGTSQVSNLATLCPTCTCLVTRTNDSEISGTLRTALLDANKGKCGIVAFNVSASSPVTFNLGSLLPAITTNVRIMGQTQPGYIENGSPAILIKESVVLAAGLNVKTDYASIDAIGISGFGQGIVVAGQNNVLKRMEVKSTRNEYLNILTATNQVQGNLIQDCKFGTIGNSAANAPGIVVSGKGNRFENTTVANTKGQNIVFKENSDGNSFKRGSLTGSGGSDIGLRNAIYFDVSTNPNVQNKMPAPQITSHEFLPEGSLKITGISNSTSDLVQLYTNNGLFQNALVYLKDATSDGTNWTVILNDQVYTDESVYYFIASATDLQNNTSPLSNSYATDYFVCPVTTRNESNIVGQTTLRNAIACVNGVGVKAKIEFRIPVPNPITTAFATLNFDNATELAITNKSGVWIDGINKVLNGTKWVNGAEQTKITFKKNTQSPLFLVNAGSSKVDNLKWDGINLTISANSGHSIKNNEFTSTDITINSSASQVDFSSNIFNNKGSLTVSSGTGHTIQNNQFNTSLVVINGTVSNSQIIGNTFTKNGTIASGRIEVNGSKQILISQNLFQGQIGSDKSITLQNNGNEGKAAPAISFVDAFAKQYILKIKAANVGETVELFSGCAEGECATTFIGQYVTGADGSVNVPFEYGDLGALNTNLYFVATTRDALGNTSPLSTSYKLSSCNVTSTADNNVDGTLRYEIQEANNGTCSLINFNIATASKEIVLDALLPPLSVNGIILNASSQPGFITEIKNPDQSVLRIDSIPQVTIKYNSSNNGIRVGSSGQKVNGLIFDNFSNAIEVNNAINAKISYCDFKNVNKAFQIGYSEGTIVRENKMSPSATGYEFADISYAPKTVIFKNDINIPVDGMGFECRNSNNVTIKTNKLTSSAQGIFGLMGDINDCENFIFESDTLIGSNPSLHLSNCVSPILVSNTFKKTNNVADSSPRIKLNTTQGARIGNNVFYGEPYKIGETTYFPTYQYGLEIIDDATVVVNNNEIEDVTNYGIHYKSSIPNSLPIIKENYVRLDYSSLSNGEVYGINTDFTELSTNSIVKVLDNLVQGYESSENGLISKKGVGIKIVNGTGSEIHGNDVSVCDIGVHLPPSTSKVSFLNNSLGQIEAKSQGNNVGLLVESNENTIGTKTSPNTFAFNIKGGLKNSGENNQIVYNVFKHNELSDNVPNHLAIDNLKNSETGNNANGNVQPPNEISYTRISGIPDQSSTPDQFVIIGKSAPNAKIHAYLSEGFPQDALSLLAEATADASGVWTFTITESLNQKKTIYMVATATVEGAQPLTYNTSELSKMIPIGTCYISNLDDKFDGTLIANIDGDPELEILDNEYPLEGTTRAAIGCANTVPEKALVRLFIENKSTLLEAKLEGNLQSLICSYGLDWNTLNPEKPAVAGEPGVPAELSPDGKKIIKEEIPEIAPQDAIPPVPLTLTYASNKTVTKGLTLELPDKTVDQIPLDNKAVISNLNHKDLNVAYELNSKWVTIKNSSVVSTCTTCTGNTSTFALINTDAINHTFDKVTGEKLNSMILAPSSRTTLKNITITNNSKFDNVGTFLNNPSLTLEDSKIEKTHWKDLNSFLIVEAVKNLTIKNDTLFDSNQSAPFIKIGKAETLSTSLNFYNIVRGSSSTANTVLEVEEGVNVEILNETFKISSSLTAIKIGNLNTYSTTSSNNISSNKIKTQGKGICLSGNTANVNGNTILSGDVGIWANNLSSSILIGNNISVSGSVSGSVVLYDRVNPTSEKGKIGDFYINTETKELFGPKAAEGWPTPLSMVTPPDADKPDQRKLIQGTDDPVKEIGNVGDLYLNTVTNKIFGPKYQNESSDIFWTDGVSIEGKNINLIELQSCSKIRMHENLLYGNDDATKAINIHKSDELVSNGGKLTPTIDGVKTVWPTSETSDQNTTWPDVIEEDKKAYLELFGTSQSEETIEIFFTSKKVRVDNSELTDPERNADRAIEANTTKTFSFNTQAGIDGKWKLKIPRDWYRANNSLYVTVTATKFEEGNEDEGSTSELSNVFAIPTTSIECVVENVNDNGAGSLRNACNCVNGTDFKTKMVFRIPDSEPLDLTKPHNIKLVTPLPELYNYSGFTIDGKSQGSFSGATGMQKLVMVSPSAAYFQPEPTEEEPETTDVVDPIKVNPAFVVKEYVGDNTSINGLIISGFEEGIHLKSGQAEVENVIILNEFSPKPFGKVGVRVEEYKIIKPGDSNNDELYPLTDKTMSVSNSAFIGYQQGIFTAKSTDKISLNDNYFDEVELGIQLPEMLDKQTVKGNIFGNVWESGIVYNPNKESTKGINVFDSNIFGKRFLSSDGTISALATKYLGVNPSNGATTTTDYAYATVMNNAFRFEEIQNSVIQNNEIYRIISNEREESEVKNEYDNTGIYLKNAKDNVILSNGFGWERQKGEADKPASNKGIAIKSLQEEKAISKNHFSKNSISFVEKAMLVKNSRYDIIAGNEIGFFTKTVNYILDTVFFPIGDHAIELDNSEDAIISTNSIGDFAEGKHGIYIQNDNNTAPNILMTRNMIRSIYSGYDAGGIKYSNTETDVVKNRLPVIQPDVAMEGTDYLILDIKIPNSSASGILEVFSAYPSNTPTDLDVKKTTRNQSRTFVGYGYHVSGTDWQIKIYKTNFSLSYDNYYVATYTHGFNTSPFSDAFRLGDILCTKVGGSYLYDLTKLPIEPNYTVCPGTKMVLKPNLENVDVSWYELKKGTKSTPDLVANTPDPNRLDGLSKYTDYGDSTVFSVMDESHFAIRVRSRSKSNCTNTRDFVITPKASPTVPDFLIHEQAYINENVVIVNRADETENPTEKPVWEFNGGKLVTSTPANEKNYVVVQFPNGGDYTVSQTYSLDGCTHTLAKKVNVKVREQGDNGDQPVVLTTGKILNPTLTSNPYIRGTTPPKLSFETNQRTFFSIFLVRLSDGQALQRFDFKDDNFKDRADGLKEFDFQVTGLDLLPAGTYMLRVEMPADVYTFKLVVL